MRAIAGLCVALLLGAGAAAADPIVRGGEHCVIGIERGDRLAVRSHPDSDARVEGSWAASACGIRVLGACRGNWCVVENGRLLGWASRAHLAAVSQVTYCVAGLSSGEQLALRAEPSGASREVASIGASVCGIEMLPYAQGRWQKVRVVGRQGWVDRRHLRVR